MAWDPHGAIEGVGGFDANSAFGQACPVVPVPDGLELTREPVDVHNFLETGMGVGPLAARSGRGAKKKGSGYARNVPRSL